MIKIQLDEFEMYHARKLLEAQNRVNMEWEYWCRRAMPECIRDTQDEIDEDAQKERQLTQAVHEGATQHQWILDAIKKRGE